LLTTNHIISETYTLMSVRLGVTVASAFLERVRTSPHTERVFVPDTWESQAESLLSQYADHDFSYVDATSFITMRHHSHGVAFTFDHHFAVAGFSLIGL
jgi:predicted nucleic acid-binding protein